MAKNRKNQSAAIRFGPALKAFFLCFVIAGSAVGYVWQKSEIYKLGRQIRQSEIRLTQLQKDNREFSRDLSALRSPLALDRRANELKLGLAPAQPAQVLRLREPIAAPAKNENSMRQLVQRKQ
jgi:hypothetical protein